MFYIFVNKLLSEIITLTYTNKANSKINSKIILSDLLTVYNANSNRYT